MSDPDTAADPEVIGVPEDVPPEVRPSVTGVVAGPIDDDAADAPAASGRGQQSDVGTGDDAALSDVQRAVVEAGGDPVDENGRPAVEGPNSR